jgi:hypothetical protein
MQFKRLSIYIHHDYCVVLCNSSSSSCHISRLGRLTHKLVLYEFPRRTAKNAHQLGRWGNLGDEDEDICRKGLVLEGSLVDDMYRLFLVLEKRADDPEYGVGKR